MVLLLKLPSVPYGPAGPKTDTGAWAQYDTGDGKREGTQDTHRVEAGQYARHLLTNTQSQRVANAFRSMTTDIIQRQ